MTTNQPPQTPEPPFNPQGPQAYGAMPNVVPPRPKKPWFKKWWVWMLALIVVVGIGNSLGGGGTKTTTAAQTAKAADAAGTSSGAPASSVAPASSAPAPKERLTLDDGWTIDKSNPYAVFVGGYVSNNTDKAIDIYVQITFDALDKAGANVGTCFANTNTIDAGGKWKFKAMCTGEVKDIARVRFKDITGL